VLLLTGATGTIGLPLLRRLTDAGIPVRCLVRDPRRLGAQRVRVQIALGDLADPFSFRHALRGVQTVVHLAATIRDQPAGSIEEIDGVASWRLVRAAELAGVERFVFCSTLGASAWSRARLMRAKALAEKALAQSSISSTVFAPSMVYSPGDHFITLLERLSLLPVMPISGEGRASFQPIWAEDVAECLMSVLPGGAMADQAAGARYELAGPETLTYLEIVHCVLRSLHRRRPVLKVPEPLVRRLLGAMELLMGPTAIATWDEAELLEVPLISPRGTADAELLGIEPKPMAAILGVG
jgi:NADH dehydrogenase